MSQVAAIKQYLPSAIATRRANTAALHDVDFRLVEWGQWARTQADYLGYPRLSLIYKVLRRHSKRLGSVARPLELRLKGITARGTETRSLRPKTVGEVPTQIAQVDRAVASLEPDKQEILRVEYLMCEDSVEAKASLLSMYTLEYKARLKRAKLSVSRRLLSA